MLKLGQRRGIVGRRVFPAEHSHPKWRKKNPISRSFNSGRVTTILELEYKGIRSSPLPSTFDLQCHRKHHIMMTTTKTKTTTTMPTIGMLRSTTASSNKMWTGIILVSSLSSGSLCVVVTDDPFLLVSFRGLFVWWTKKGLTAQLVCWWIT